MKATSSTIRSWLSRIDKDTKGKRNKRIFEAWMSCDTQEEIAEREGIPRSTVETILTEMAELPESSKPVASHLVDFDRPLYNVWKFKEKTEGTKHFGNSEEVV